MDTLTILNECATEFITAAAMVGIDGGRLLRRLPPSGTLLTGHQVPVLTAKYRGSCSVLFYINNACQGGNWPYVRFHTFKHGGLTTEFNGLRSWLGRGGATRRPNYNPALDKKVRQNDIGFTHVKENGDEREQKRLVTLQALLADYYRADPVTMASEWLKYRLCGLANQGLLTRLSARQTPSKAILFPLSHPDRGLIGYHKITPTAQGDQKRHYIQQSGLLKSTSIAITGLEYSRQPVALCEGVATGLTIALFWTGPVVIALCAHNLAAVRQTLSQHQMVCFFADNDQWKPEVGNVGINAAMAARLPRDVVVWPRFFPGSHASRPTDFNDLLRLEGPEETCRQIIARQN